MNLEKAKILLDKINGLHKSMRMDEGNIASIELDLMRSYIRQLYETFLEESDLSTPQTSSNTTPKPQQPAFEVAKKEKKEEYSYRPPRIIEIPDSLRDKEEEPAPKPKPKPVQQPEEQQQSFRSPSPEPKPQPEPKKEEATNGLKPEHEVLFEKQNAKELSEKLSEQPINDLTKAIALNDKLLYANELFNKELSDFNKAIYRINNMSSFEEAKTYVSELAEQYNWTDEERLDRAKDLSKLIRRRFLQ